MKRGSSEVVVYGRRAVGEALATRACEVLSVRATARLAGDARTAIARACRARGLALEGCSPREMQSLAGDPRNDQGVAAEVRLLRVRELDGFLADQRGANARQTRRVLAIDGITNSQNVGMIVRSAVAAGMDGILWPLHDAPWINGLVVKASAGAVLRAPIVRCESLPLALGELQGAGFRVHGLQARTGEALFEHRPSHRSVFVVGAETAGLTPAVAGLVDGSLHIPMAEDSESLNVAVAAALVCFHVRSTPEP